MDKSQHNPNAGEGQKFYDSSASRSSTTKVNATAGVQSGLSEVEAFSPTAGGTEATDNQRPMSQIENIGDGMKAGF